jgi:hypothetical protein
MKYVVEMGSGAMIYISNFIRLVQAIKSQWGGIHRHTDIMEIA